MCNGTSIVSYFFNIDANDQPNPFFDWQGETNPSVNLTMLSDKSFGMFENLTGYAGTDSMPDCPYRTCWYLLEKAYTLSQAQFDFFKVPNVLSNNRQLAGYESYKVGIFSFGPFKSN